MAFVDPASAGQLGGLAGLVLFGALQKPFSGQCPPSGPGVGHGVDEPVSHPEGLPADLFPSGIEDVDVDQVGLVLRRVDLHLESEVLTGGTECVCAAAMRGTAALVSLLRSQRKARAVQNAFLSHSTALFTYTYYHGCWH